MTNSKTAPTLRELLIAHERVVIQVKAEGKTIFHIEWDMVDELAATLLAPLHNEIATLNARLRILQNQITIRDGEIAALRTKVAAADVLFLAAKPAMKDQDPFQLSRFSSAIAAYDATKTESTAALVGEDEHQEECNLAARHEREFREWVKHRPDLGGTYLNLMHHWIGDEFGNPPGFATPPAVEDAERSCIECGGQGYWDDPRSASLRRTCWTCKGTGITPPAVEDAGETGEEPDPTNPPDEPAGLAFVMHLERRIAELEQSDLSTTRMLRRLLDGDDDRIARNEKAVAALRRDVTQIEAFAAGSIEPTAALRRDVDALKLTRNDAMSIDSWITELRKRTRQTDGVLEENKIVFEKLVNRIESRERPEPGGVRDVGAVAALNAWHGVSEYNYSKRQIEQMREAINIALAAEAGR